MMILELSTTRQPADQIEERARRRRLFALAYRDDPVVARLALRILWKLYRVRLPLIEERLGITVSSYDSV